MDSQCGLFVGNMTIRRFLDDPVFWQTLIAVIVGILALVIFFARRRVLRAQARRDYGYTDRPQADRPFRREETPEEMLERVRRQNS